MTMKKLKVNEIFCSIQGEGIMVGVPMNFIKFTKCNLKCKWCDTDFKEGKEISLEEILEKLNSNIGWVSLTGGEPLMERNLLSLIKRLKEENYKILLETNGTKFDKNIFEESDFVSIDLKTPSSGNSTYSKEVFSYALKNPNKTQFKVVVKNLDDDLGFFEKVYQEGESYDNWIIQPEWSSYKERAGDYETSYGMIIKKFPNVRLIPQVHKIMKMK